MYIAHISKDKKRIQSVKDHVMQAAQIAENNLSGIGLGKTGRLAALLHDMGKLSPQFQDYMNKILNDERAVKGSVNHSLCGARYVFNEFKCSSDSEILTKEIICLAVICHHGGLMDVVDDHGCDCLDERLAAEHGISYDSCVREFHRTILDEIELQKLFSAAVNEINIISDGITSFSRGLLVKLIYSAVIDGDRYNSYCFEAEAEPENVKTCSAEFTDLMNAYIKQFDGLGGLVNSVRREISDLCFDSAGRQSGIYRLCVPTGSGKTVSSLRYAIEHCRQHHKRRIFYIIPYQSIIDQNAKVVRNILGDENVLIHHSNVLNGSETDEQWNEYELLTERWNESVIMTTMVQFLNTFYSGGTQDVRRLHALSESVIIFDEVQALNTKCICLFTQALNFLKNICKCNIVLCSATQPDFEALPKGYGLQYSEEAELVPDYNKYFEMLKRTRIVNMTDRIMECDELAQFILERSAENDKVLVIMNTKKAARDLYETLKGSETEVLLLTTLFCMKHREKILERIKNGKKFICISTQLVEAGVDIDMDCVIRSYAGLDSLVQAAGRCNRNGGNAIKNVYFVKVCFENLLNLEEIKTAQTASGAAIRNKNDNEDLTDTSVLKKFYLSMRNEIKEDELKYKMSISKNNNLTLCDLMNKGFSIPLKKRSRIKRIITQAFRTVGENFKVINADNVSVIVPYEYGREIIQMLQSSKTPIKEKYKLIRAAAKYTVNLYVSARDELLRNNGISKIEDLNIYYVNEGFYNEDTGLEMGGVYDSVY